MIIKPLQPKPILHALSCFDIETGKKGQLLDIGYRHENDYQTFKTWYSFLLALYNQTNEISPPPTILWAHNGGKFDVVSLLMEIHKNEQQYNFIASKTARLINGAVLELQIEFINGEHVLCRDSFRLFPMALEKVSKAFTGQGKNAIPDEYKSKMDEYKKKHRREYYAYLEQDVNGLYNSLYIFRNLINDISPVGDLPLSLGSLALKVFRTSYLKQEIQTPSKKVQEFIEPSYSGGRTEFFGMGKHENNIYKGCNYYDYNSMYPAQMLNGLYPTGNAAWTNELERYDDGVLIPGAYEIVYKQTGGHIPLLRDQSTGKKSKEHQWGGFGVYIAEEIEYLLKMGAEVHIKRGVIFPEAAPIFHDFIDALYKIRMKARAEGNQALDLVAKLLMNNLYGKFGQREETEELQFLTMQEVKQILEDIESGKEQKIISVSNIANDEENAEGKSIYSVKKTSPVPHRHVMIAALITGRCRRNITALAERYWQDAIYCDTDSFITQATIDPALICPKTLGMLKPEYENVTMEFWGRKQYRILEKDEIKQKGVQIKEKEKFVVDVRTDDGYYAEYYAPSSIKQAAKSGTENANEFKKYHRTIKADLSSFEKGLIKV